jgi:hypothetical protein
VDSIIN